jgi:GalNAc-alpha-(1->4)-GalNAc-alpha-(1->3)-diNAcBac-PP-undecaprenol alpha-1,4-N-acetyl-D-galactosaminyltransferase
MQYPQQKKIVLVIPSLHTGGMERVMSELAFCFYHQMNAKVDMVLLGIDEQFYTLPPAITIHEPNFKFNTLGRLKGTIKTMRFLRDKLHELQPDTVLSFGEMYNSFVLLASVGTKYPIYISDRSKPDKNWGKFHHLLRFISYHRAKGIIAQTAYAKKIMAKRLFWSNIKVIGNPIESSKVVEDEKSPRKNIILTVGRLIPSKRHALLITLFSKANNAGWQLQIIGDGPERNALEHLVASLQLQQQVVFLGNQKDLLPYYQSAKIFAFTSNSEGFPNALGEAMSAGLAPITFNFIAGATDLVTNNENGFVVPMEQEEEYLVKLNELMSNNSLVEQLGNNAKKAIVKFDKNEIAKQFYQFILS